MSRWARVSALNVDLNGIYGNLLPVKVRHHVSEWLESNSTNGDPAKFLQNLVEKIEETALLLPASVNRDERLNLFLTSKEINRKFEHEPAKLQEIIVEIFRREEELLQQAAQPDFSPNVPIIMDSFQIQLLNETEFITNQLSTIKGRTENCSQLLKQINSTFGTLSTNINSKMSIQDFAWQWQHSPGEPNDIVSHNEMRCQELENAIQANEGIIQDLKSRLEQDSFITFDHLANVQSRILTQDLASWKHEQRQRIDKDFLEKKLNQIETWLHDIANGLQELLKLVSGIKEIKQTYTKFQRNNIVLLDGFDFLSKQVMEQLRQVLQQGFVIEEQPRHVLKTKTQYTKIMRVRHLVLGMTANRPDVQVDIIDENTAKRLWEGRFEFVFETSKESIKEFGNLSGRKEKMEPDANSGHFTAAFPKLALEIKRRAKSVCDFKYALLCRANVEAFGITVQIWTISEPIVVIVHSSYEVQAWGTIVWDQEFAEMNRIPFAICGGVNSQQFRRLLNREFKALIGKDLTNEHFSFLWRKVHWGTQGVVDFVTISEFCKDKAQGPNGPYPFTYWAWFYAATNLIAKHFLEEWKNNLIFGFAGKEEAERQLSQSSCEPGTFLVRFPESVLGAISITYKKQDGTSESLHAFTSKDLNAKPFSDMLRDLNRLTKVYPDKEKKVFGGSCAAETSQSAVVRLGYKPVVSVLTILGSGSEPQPEPAGITEEDGRLGDVYMLIEDAMINSGQNGV